MITKELTHAEKMRRCDLADRDARIEMKPKYSHEEMTKIAVSEYRRGRTQAISEFKEKIEEKIIEVGLVEDEFTIKILRELLKSLEQKA